MQPWLFELGGNIKLHAAATETKGGFKMRVGYFRTPQRKQAYVAVRTSCRVVHWHGLQYRFSY